ncbi:MAG TPA: PEP-CTERM sorting domain-containing protein, partial [Pirellulales bacterium]
NPGGGVVSFGTGASALGPAGTDTTAIVSLGDGGHITLGLVQPITNGPGADFAVFENSFADTFLELAFVEVSSDGTNFFRFPSVSLTSTATQIGSFGALDPTNLYDLAGKYRVGFGTPFDLNELAGISSLLDVNDVQFVRIVDVGGTINPQFASRDSLGNIVNDPYPTAFASGGFDLDGVGVINAVPEPAAYCMAAIGLTVLFGVLRRKMVLRKAVSRDAADV